MIFRRKPTELYNLNSDLGEIKNLAASKKVKELTSLLDKWSIETDAKMTEENPNYTINK